MAIGIALLGAGIWAREQHLPAIAACPDLSLKAIYSRSQASVNTVIAAHQLKDVTAYFDSPTTRGHSLADLLARDDIHAVVIALPILQLPAAIQLAITAGKHVLSEKPVGKDVMTARNLIGWYERRLPLSRSAPVPVWCVGENFRFIDRIVFARQKLLELGGDLQTFRCTVLCMMDPNDKFCKTEWRSKPGFQGGYLLDAGIHFIAMLRYLLAATGQEIQHVAAFTSLQQPHLAPVDTLSGSLRTANGCTGTLQLSFGTPWKTVIQTEVVTSRGAVLIDFADVIVTSALDDGSQQAKTDKSSFDFGFGVEDEVRAFAKGISQPGSAVDPRCTPREALKDLVILQKLLESGQNNGDGRAVC
ncbi:hypothetical protein ASPZODRAFT_17298 [Penicilliopsis zonata CBS 506.65]|uniref:Gfo/Idh/MocA-like oxidoreductase N-terminal domain-containing protein n=1 Tax=Penicilliopsis zonata CBS 506.65 TaxID=1073090 RepID=A0A1L9SF87_9EURO|nr:hypothetical protein ASPZODRAFT_17298 [Penicilliopsis zonata CBS 506.65]OJJ45861.1 hypothetical protein ASPZODRAFT_17298 [Penicilliopsis zonata CBS 506.65]